MEGFLSLAVSALTGFIFGILVCIPVGPVNVTIINEGARCGFKWAAMIGAGATTMELIYCGIAFTGFASFFETGWIKSAMEGFSFLFLMALGLKFLLAKKGKDPRQLGAPGDKLEERIQEKLHPHSAFMIGFVRTLANPGVLVGWIALSAIFISRKWVAPTWPSKWACIAGVGVGVGLWFFGISWAISFGHKKMNGNTMLKMERISGICLLVIGAAQGAYMAWHLMKHKVGG